MLPKLGSFYDPFLTIWVIFAQNPSWKVSQKWQKMAKMSNLVINVTSFYWFFGRSKISKLTKIDKNGQNPSKKWSKNGHFWPFFDPNLGPLNLNITQFMEKYEKTKNLKTIYFRFENFQKKWHFLLQLFLPKKVTFFDEIIFIKKPHLTLFWHFFDHFRVISEHPFLGKIVCMSYLLLITRHILVILIKVVQKVIKKPIFLMLTKKCTFFHFF